MALAEQENPGLVGVVEKGLYRSKRKLLIGFMLIMKPDFRSSKINIHHKIKNTLLIL